MHADALEEMTLMKRMNLMAVAATLALGLFACDRNADRASQTNTTSASQPVENPGGGTPAPTTAPPIDTSTSVNADLKDGGHAGMTTTTGSDMDTNATDSSHRSGTNVDKNTNKNTDKNTDKTQDKNLDKKGKTTAPGHTTTLPDRSGNTPSP
jgi:hypothetical protein